MPEDDPSKEPKEKTYRDWLDEALARDEQTWDALDQKLKQLKQTKTPEGKPKPAYERPPKPLDW